MMMVKRLIWHEEIPSQWDQLKVKYTNHKIALSWAISQNLLTFKMEASTSGNSSLMKKITKIRLIIICLLKILSCYFHITLHTFEKIVQYPIELTCDFLFSPFRWIISKLARFLETSLEHSQVFRSKWLAEGLDFHTCGSKGDILQLDF